MSEIGYSRLTDGSAGRANSGATRPAPNPAAAATPSTRSLLAARRAWAPADGLLLMAAVGLAANLTLVGCSQPRGEGPKNPGASAESEAPEGMLTVGAMAPDLTGKDANGQPVSLHDRRGNAAIVYFYPKDGTPGCTKEACAFRDAFDRFTQRNVTIFGVSRDDEASHDKFRAEHALPFPLVADPEGKVQKAYGVPNKFPGLAARVTFLVAADGRIAKVWPDVDPGVHADEVLQAIEQLK